MNSYSHLEVERSKVKVTRPLDVVIENQPYLRNGKGCMGQGHTVAAGLQLVLSWIGLVHRPSSSEFHVVDYLAQWFEHAYIY